MISLLFLMSLLSVSYGSVYNDFVDYTREYNKNYNSSEFELRFRVFQNNTNFINKHNSNSYLYRLGVNNFTDWTNHEFQTMYLRKNLSPGRTNNFTNYRFQNRTLPSSIDWRANGFVTDVKDQGQCGSCWAFSAVGAIEGQHANATGNLVSLSEQNLVDCSYNYSNEGCDGGWPDKAMLYVRDHGIDTEKSYPYGADDGSCSFNKTNVGATVRDVVLLQQGNMSALYEALATVGPMSVAIDAESDFQFYSSGIYNSTMCSPDQLDHAVLAVGYGVTLDGRKYIIVKNSWGTSWGMDGYIYMSADTDNLCGIAEHVSFPLV